MIRPARFADEPVIEAMIREMHAASKYAGRVAISDKALTNVVRGLIASHGSTGPQGTWVAVAEEDGKVVGFMAGVLDRVYHVGSKLVANDAYLVVRPGAKAAHSLQLIDGYVAWAQGIRAVLEIKLSWTNTLPGAARAAKIYERKGFAAVGEIYEMRLDAEDRELAA